MNSKYDNLAMLLGQGKFNWGVSPVYGLLWKGVTFNAGHKRLSEIKAISGTVQITSVPVPARYVAPDGSFMGNPVSFNRVGKDTDYQLLLVVQDQPQDPALIAYYDRNQADQTLRLKNNGTLIVRPVATQGTNPPTIGVWLKP